MMNLHNVVVADIKPKTESVSLRDRLIGHARAARPSLPHP